MEPRFQAPWHGKRRKNAVSWPKNRKPIFQAGTIYGDMVA